MSDDGVVDCWGEPVWMPVDASLRSLHLGLALSCALSTTGEVWCGRHSEEVERVEGLQDATHVDVGLWDACAVHSGGKVSCWSDFRPDPVRIRGVSEAVQVEVGSLAACARSDDGRVWCWWLRRRSAQRMLGVEPAVDVAVGDEIWTLGASGEVTALDLHRRRVPSSALRRTQISDLSDAIDIEGSEDVGCARRHDGGVACWGSEVAVGWPALPTSDWLPHTAVAIPNLHDSVEISVAGNHACSRDSDESIWCWGDNVWFVLGDANSRPLVPDPHRVDALPPVVEIHVGRDQACAVEPSGALWCWGYLYEAGLTPIRDVPVILSRSTFVNQELESVKGLLVGDGPDCARFSPTLLTCWGDDAPALSYPLGDIVIPTGTRSIDVGSLWGCMAGTYGVECFGSPTYATEYSVRSAPEDVRPRTPVPFPEPTSATAVVVGSGHACALLEDRSVWCWGNNGLAQLDAELPSVRPLAERDIPVKVERVPELFTLSTGPDHTCGLDAEGTAWCWGGATETRADGRPRSVTGLPPLRVLAAGSRHNCGIALDDTVWCWELGADPSQVPGLRDIVAIDAHGETDCALDRAGAVHCWGDNRLHMADPSSPISSAIPLEVDRSRMHRIGE